MRIHFAVFVEYNRIFYRFGARLNARNCYEIYKLKSGNLPILSCIHTHTEHEIYGRQYMKCAVDNQLQALLNTHTTTPNIKHRNDTSWIDDVISDSDKNDLALLNDLNRTSWKLKKQKQNNMMCARGCVSHTRFQFVWRYKWFLCTFSIICNKCFASL